MALKSLTLVDLLLQQRTLDLSSLLPLKVVIEESSQRQTYRYIEKEPTFFFRRSLKLDMLLIF